MQIRAMPILEHQQHTGSICIAILTQHLYTRPCDRSEKASGAMPGVAITSKASCTDDCWCWTAIASFPGLPYARTQTNQKVH